MLGTRGAGSAVRSVGSATSVIGSSTQSWKRWMKKTLPGKNPRDSTKCKIPTFQCRNLSYLKLQLSRPNFMCTSVVWGTKNCTIFVDDRIVWSLISLVFSIVLNECSRAELQEVQQINSKHVSEVVYLVHVSLNLIMSMWIMFVILN